MSSCRPDTPTNGSACVETASPNYMLQSYVDAVFSASTYPPQTASPADGGRIDMVRTWDTTPPTLVYISAESRSETSITVVLQLNEPGTAYCRAYNDTQNATDLIVADIAAAPNGPFGFELPSDSSMRIYAAHAYRDFEITVTGLTREVLYFVYCAAEDDEASDGCEQRDMSDDPACGNNQAAPYLVEADGRYTL